MNRNENKESKLDKLKRIYLKKSKEYLEKLKGNKSQKQHILKWYIRLKKKEQSKIKLVKKLLKKIKFIIKQLMIDFKKNSMETLKISVLNQELKVKQIKEQS